MKTYYKNGEIYIELPNNEVTKLEDFVRRYTRGGQLETFILDDSFAPCEIKAEYKMSDVVLSKVKSKKPNFFKAVLKYGKKDN